MRWSNKLPVSFHLPEIIKGPWTREARQMALDRDILAHYIEYFGKAMETRNWSPWHHLPFEEMRQLGHRLSEETKHVIEGFLGVEEYIGDYVLEGLRMFRDDRTRRNMQLQWGAEEARHGMTWDLVLKHSLARTEEQLRGYLDKVRQFHWDPNDHPGMDTPIGVAAYAMVQERATYFNYQELRARVREDCGLPASPTPEENQRGYEVGASHALKLVAVDEIAHHGIFLKVVLTHMRYFPSATFESLVKVFQGFKMPAVHLLPNKRHFLRALRRTQIHTATMYRDQVHNPVLRSLGLENDGAFERAVQAIRLLPEGLGPDALKLSRTGEWVIAKAGAAG
jgi:acyl-[acyl-carrier-protein] desaturase